MSGNKPDVEKRLYCPEDSGRGGDEWDIGEQSESQDRFAPPHGLILRS